MKITVELATGNEYTVVADAWETHGDVVTVTKAGTQVASYRNWLMVYTDDEVVPVPRGLAGPIDGRGKRSA